MPQLDILTFFSQIFWLLLIFFTFYFLILKEFLLDLSLTVKLRKRVFSSSFFLLKEQKIRLLMDNLQFYDFVQRSLNLNNKRLLSLRNNLSLYKKDCKVV